MLKKVKNFMLMALMFLMTTVVSFGKEAQNAKSTSSFSTVLGSGGGGGSSSAQIQVQDFGDVINFLITFRTVIIVVIAVAGTVYFLIGLFKFFANPELSQITQYVVVFVLAIIISFAVYKIVDKISGTEIPLNAVVTNELNVSGE
jgi:hypothetical protein